MGYEHLGTVLHTGLQTLAVLGVGWAIARWRLLQQAGTDGQVVSLLNVLIMRVCLPALQLLLLAVQTDMRHMQNWRLLAAFMLWTAVIQVGAGVWVLLLEGGRLERWGVHALVLAANNTGVLAPVVLDAALGTGTGYIGMLATVCLYFQQLPVSEALMAAGQAAAGQSSPASQPSQGTYHSSSDFPNAGSFTFQPVSPHAPGSPDWQRGPPGSKQQIGAHHGAHHAAHLAAHHTAHHEAHRAAYPGADQGEGGQWQAGVGVQGHPMDVQGIGLETVESGAYVAPLTGPNGAKQKQLNWVTLLVQNPLVWTTGFAAVLSMGGSSELLAQGGRHSIKELAFVSGSLEWLARCSVPLTLLSTGVWLHGRTHLLWGENSRMVAAYLVLKLFVLPWVMVAITQVMGIGGSHGMALVLLTVVPVGQTAFVLSERYRCCTEAVTATLIAGLLLLLPHLLLVLWVAERLGLYMEIT